MSGADGTRRGASRRALLRASAGLLPLAVPVALGGCDLLDDLFSESKVPLPGKREAIAAPRRGLETDIGRGSRVVLPPEVTNAAWPQPGGNPAHLMGHLASGDRLAEAWTADIGTGGGYRRKILAQPLIDGGLVHTMDSDGTLSAFDAGTGERRWRAETRDEDDDSTNVGGGMAIDGGALYAVNGLGWLHVCDAATGTMKFRKNLGAPLRSAPTVADGRLFVVTIQDRLLALAAEDGRQLWMHQAATAATSLLGQPAPAYAGGLIVAGFGSGELAALRAESGGVAWTDSLASVQGRNSLSGVSAIRGLPVIADGRVYVIGLGGLMLAIDQRTGRRLWERDVAGEDSLWVAGDWVFVISGDQQVAAVSRLDGTVAWVTDLPRFEDEKKQKDNILWFGPVLTGDRLIVAGTTEEATAISPYTGEVLGKQTLSGAASLAPVVANGTVYIVTDDGRLLALR